VPWAIEHVCSAVRRSLGTGKISRAHARADRT